MSEFLKRVFFVGCLVFFLLSSVGCRQTDEQISSTTKDQPPLATVAGETATQSNAPEWELVWSDEFDGNELDLEKWKYELGSHGWGNDELQEYTAGDNAEVNNGTLKIIARKTGPGQKAGDYTSTRLNSDFSFTYGRVEASAKMPELKGVGLWPAIWMLGENIKTVSWPHCGELDIMEYLSRRPDKVSSAIHTLSTKQPGQPQIESGPVDLETAEEEFHVYGIEWTETQIKFYIDDPTNVTCTYDRPEDFDENNWPFDKPQYILLNVAVGGSWGGDVDDSIFPAQMEVDYVRVYQMKK